MKAVNPMQKLLKQIPECENKPEDFKMSEWSHKWQLPFNETK